MCQEGDRAAHLAALAAEFGERLELMAEAGCAWAVWAVWAWLAHVGPSLESPAGPASQCHESQGDVPSGAEAHGGREESDQHRSPNCISAALEGFGSPRRVGCAALQFPCSPSRLGSWKLAEVFSVEYGTEVDTFGVDSSGLWRRVFCQCTRVAKQDTLARCQWVGGRSESTKHETIAVAYHHNSRDQYHRRYDMTINLY